MPSPRDVLLPRAKSGYVAATRAVTRIARVQTGDAAPPLRPHWRHWVASLPAVHDSLAIARLDVPWWSYRAIDAVETWLSDRPRPIRVFEYGSGASTLWLARRADEVHSVEHHPGFGAMMSDTVAGMSGVSLRVVPAVPAENPVVPSAKEGNAGQDFQAYVRAIDDVEGRFDLVVVDGRAREACLVAALDRLADDGLVVFDNSLRRRYRRAIAAAPVVEKRYLGLTPTLPYPDQTSLLRRR